MYPFLLRLIVALDMFVERIDIDDEVGGQDENSDGDVYVDGAEA
jgi:hypothetical protein